MKIIALLVVLLICSVGISSAVDSEITAFANNYTSDSDTMFNCTQTTIQFNITVDDSANISWFDNKINITTDFGSLNHNFTVSDTFIHEIRAETNNGTYIDVKEWIVTNKSITNAPTVFESWTDENYAGGDTDAWGRTAPTWTVRTGTAVMENCTLSSSSNYLMMETSSTGLYGTWKFDFKFIRPDSSYDYSIALFPIMNDSWDGSNYAQHSVRVLKATDEHLWLDYLNDDSTRCPIAYSIPSMCGSNFYPISSIGATWHNLTIIHNTDGRWEMWIDDEFVPYSKRIMDEILTCTDIGIQLTNSNTLLSEIDNIEYYKNQSIYPDSSCTYDAGNNTITIKGVNNTLLDVYNDIANDAIFSYSGNVYSSTANISIGMGAEIKIDDETLYINATDPHFYFNPGWNLTVKNSTIDTNSTILTYELVDDNSPITINGYTISSTNGNLYTHNSTMSKMIGFLSTDLMYCNCQDNIFNLETNSTSHSIKLGPSGYMDGIFINKNNTFQDSGRISSHNGFIFDSDITCTFQSRGSSYLVNVNYNPASENNYWEFYRYFYYYLDVYAVNSDGIPIESVNIAVSNNVDETVKSRTKSDYTYSWIHPATGQTSNLYKSWSVHPSTTSFLTSSNGHTPLPNDTGTIMIVDNRVYSPNANSSTQKTDYTYTITATKDETGLKTIYLNSTNVPYTNSTNSTIIDIDETWLRTNPNTYQNTTNLTMIPVTELFNVVIS